MTRKLIGSRAYSHYLCSGFVLGGLNPMGENFFSFFFFFSFPPPMAKACSSPLFLFAFAKLNQESTLPCRDSSQFFSNSCNLAFLSSSSISFSLFFFASSLILSSLICLFLS